jgi:hypothetical protein
LTLFSEIPSKNQEKSPHLRLLELDLKFEAANSRARKTVARPFTTRACATMSKPLSRLGEKNNRDLIELYVSQRLQPAWLAVVQIAELS